ncbi:hypothetical protein AOQ84DRAFT_368254 [Glonium stellatum]|uniref:DUF6594 domain-containing protein n=1 Tax=Glonium stellatum TaxID=574774 RepID=A0A8E2ESK3_9PEZI|nr:hypothetical protein AOQ84DRAFT_368254 [Glonium stellatum]
MTPKIGRGDIESLQLEDFRPGYPRFTALLSEDSSFYIFRRFSRARLRLLLLKQDEVCRIEEELDKIDEEEPHQIFLGCSREDRNKERQEKLDELTKAVAEFDTLTESSSHAFSYRPAATRNVNSLKTWLAGTKTIGRPETSYLDKRGDLMNLAECDDGAMERIGWFLEDLKVWFQTSVQPRVWSSAKRKKRFATSSDHVFFSGPWLQTSSRALMAWLTTLVLLVPVVLLNSLSTMVGRFVTIIIAAGIFVFAVSFITKAKTSEIFLSGAAYAAVLVVFTSNNNGLSAGQNLQWPLQHPTG